VTRSGPSLVAAASLATSLTLGACGGNGSPGAPTAPATPTPPAALPDPLREAAAQSGKLVGAAVQTSFLGGAQYTGVLDRHFNYLTAEYEMKMATIGSGPGVYNFGPGDTILAYAGGRGMRVKGHALLWHGSVPGWVNALSPDDLRSAVNAYIRAVCEHYRGRVLAWDVVNEAIADDGSMRDTVFRQKLGDGYIAEAFRAARLADPGALLFYNDYGGDGLGLKSDRIYDLVRTLVADGVPIDGVGLQMHVTATNPPPASSVASNMARIASLGLLVNISEMDVRISAVPGTVQSRLEAQRSVYRSLVGVCVAEPRCHGVTFWGFTDAHSWIDQQFGPDDPLLFDEQYAPKPAFYGVQDALLRR
jgi:endo-1,4-beta-xylanase